MITVRFGGVVSVESCIFGPELEVLDSPGGFSVGFFVVSLADAFLEVLVLALSSGGDAPLGVLCFISEPCFGSEAKGRSRGCGIRSLKLVLLASSDVSEGEL